MEYKLPVNVDVSSGWMSSRVLWYQCPGSWRRMKTRMGAGVDVDVGRSVIVCLCFRRAAGKMHSSWMMWAWMQILPAHDIWLGSVIK